MNDSEKLAINTIRALSMDAVQAANSGHPGTPMSLAPLGYLLFNERMKYDPANPNWPNRDRFVLSAGHASMLIYSLLHLSGVKQLDKNTGKPTIEPAVSLDDIKNFRQLDSRCAGHPEYGHVSGVEVTTGPLGQGAATSVGMSIAELWLAGRYNKPNFPLFDYNVYSVCGDGDMMEGITAEAASIAGHLKLSNLCWVYDDNKITIEGDTSIAFTENVKERFLAYGWNVQNVDDVNDLPTLRTAFDNFLKTTDRPTLIIVKSKIAFGAPHMQGSHEAHGAPLGEEEIKATKKVYGLPENEKFAVADSVYETFKNGIIKNEAAAFAKWSEMFAAYKKEYPELAAEMETIAKGDLPQDWDIAMLPFATDPKGMASRISSGKVLNQAAQNIPWMLGGSADLAPSNKSDLTFAGAGDFSVATPAGRNFHFGIREHAMGAAVNGMTLSGLRAYGATFFVFADYMRPAIRLAAIMQIPSMFIYTHDSIGVGEDGPTHQPIEHLASLRAIPNLYVLRPADANETTEVYKIALKSTKTPSILIFTRQNLPTIDREKYAKADNVAKGAYILADPVGGKPDVILIGTGSEVGLCLSAYEKLTAEGIKARVVSMPCWEIFEQQSAEYKESVLPSAITARVGVELGIEQGWSKYIGPKGVFLGMNGFGESGPADKLMKHFGFTTENLCDIAKKLI